MELFPLKILFFALCDGLKNWANSEKSLFLGDLGPQLVSSWEFGFFSKKIEDSNQKMIF